MKPIKYKLLIVFLLMYANTESVIAQGTTLDGKSYTVNLTSIGKNRDSSWKKDTFIFESSEMYSANMKKREGFKAAAYSPANSGTEQDPIVKFVYESSNKYGSTLKIEGTAKANTIEGTAKWTNDNGEHTYTFTGTLL